MIQKTPRIFLDIDGTLNRSVFCLQAQSSGIDRGCVERLNRVVRETVAGLVLSSSWRYMVAGGAMTLQGFSYLMRTHGLTAAATFVGITCPDEEIPLRGDQVAAWLRGHPETGPYLVLDDDSTPDGGPGPIARCQARHGHPWVRPDRSVGLTDADADAVIASLRRQAGLAPDELRCGTCGHPWTVHDDTCSRHAFRPGAVQAAKRGAIRPAPAVGVNGFHAAPRRSRKARGGP